MMYELTQAVDRMLEAAQSKTIVLIGDYCLDVYFHVDSKDSELSLETGYPVRRVNTLKVSLGGAGNVFANLCALGVGHVIPIGVIGDEIFGDEISRIMWSLQKSGKSLTVQHTGWITPTYMKPIIDGKEHERIDTGLKNKVNEETVKRLLSDVEEALKNADVILINQQLEDTIYTEEFIAGLNELAAANPQIPFIVDSRSLQNRFKDMWHKLNTYELATELGITLDPIQSYLPIDELHDLMLRYNKQTGDPLVVSRGEFGAIAYDGNSFHSAEGITLLTELDTVGAGDSFFSGFALSLAAGICIEHALHIGNSVSGVTIQKLHQTGTCTPDELRNIIANRDLTFNADEKPNRVGRPFTMKVVSDMKFIESRPAIKYAVFDHDGTISVLREGWEEIMEMCMIDAITGGKTYDSELTSKIRQDCRKFIVRSTGIQTISQMVMLVDIIKKWNLVPKMEMLTPQQYKDIYNKTLLTFIAKRVENVKKGLLTPEDVTVKGSIEFLKILAENGVKIYLASGTDQEDVHREAQLLGYADYFTGGIFGSVGDMHNDPKRQVLKNILRTERVEMERLAIFGDGPVEMREARNNGALAVGVQSNEIRRYGWNESKYNRLLYAGADILIPDFMEYNKIASFLLKKDIN